MKRLSVTKKNEAYKLLIEYFNLVEYRHNIEFDKGTMTYEELVKTVNHIAPQVRKLALDIGKIIYTPIQLHRKR